MLVRSRTVPCAVLWPAAQVVAGALVNALRSMPRSASVLELGAGTGLCSIAAAASGAANQVLATDYRREPLSLLETSARRTGELCAAEFRLRTELFDITDGARALPHVGGDAPLIVCAADLLYMRSTSVALAARCVEALRRPDVELVLIGDLGRPGRAAFLSELQAHGVPKERACFETVEGWGAPAPRHELISSPTVTSGHTGGSHQEQQPQEPPRVQVGLLALKPSDLHG